MRRFDLLGVVDNTLSISLIAMVRADGLSVRRIAELCDGFLEKTRSLPSELRLKPRGRNPNGLLGFDFEDGCPPQMIKFIRKQTRISHSALRGGVVVSWVFDLKSRRIYTHSNPVSLVPPVVITAEKVFPGLGYLSGFLQSQVWPPESARGRSHDAPSVPEWPKQYGPDGAAEAGESPENPHRKIKILFLTANPNDTSPLRLDEECRAIEEALGRSEFRERFKIKQHWAVEVKEFQQYLLRHRPHIVHFSGHGAVAGGILLEEGSGNSHSVPVEALSRLFTILKDEIRCVMLSASYSERQAEAIARHIDAVIGVEGFIERPAAIAFAAAFYGALGFGRSVQTAFDLGRVRIRMENLGDRPPLRLLATRSNPEEITFV